MAWYWYYAISSMSIFMILSGIILISTIVQLCSKRNKQIRKYYRYITMISILFNFLCILCDLIHIIWCFIVSGTLVSHSFDIILIPSDIFYYTGDLALYILLISRIYYTFQNTIYSLSRYTLLFFTILIAIFIVTSTHYCIIMAAVEDEHKVAEYNIPAAIILGITDLILNLSLIVLFIYKLKQLTALIYDIDHSEFIESPSMNEFSESVNNYSIQSNTNSMNNHSFQINSKQNKLLILITRHSVLGTFVIISNQIYWIGYMYVNYIIHGEQLDQYVSFVYTMRVFFNFVNILVLSLSLKFNKNIYDKLCFHCDGLCYKCVVKETKNEIIKMTAKEIYNQDR